MASAIVAVYATAHRTDEVEFRVQLPHLSPRFSVATRSSAGRTDICVCASCCRACGGRRSSAEVDL